jgi:hypothetical protein
MGLTVMSLTVLKGGYITYSSSMLVNRGELEPKWNQLSANRQRHSIGFAN